MGITSDELALLRDEQENYMPDLVIIRREFSAGDDQLDRGTVATDVACRITPGFGVWRNVADRFQGITAYTVTFAWDQDVKAGDQLVDAESRTFLVRDVKAHSSYQTALPTLVDLVND